MTWIDPEGVEHPSASDVVTAKGLEHIDHCPVCAERLLPRRPVEGLDTALE